MAYYTPGNPDNHSHGESPKLTRGKVRGKYPEYDCDKYPEGTKRTLSELEDGRSLVHGKLIEKSEEKAQEAARGKFKGKDHGKFSSRADGQSPEKGHLKPMDKVSRKLPDNLLEKLRNPSDSASARQEIEQYYSTKINATISEDFKKLNILSKITGLEPEAKPAKPAERERQQKSSSCSITPKIAGLLKVAETVHDRLYNACLTGDLRTVKDILRVHYTTLMPDEQGQTPLYAACIGNQPEIIEYLVDRGYTVDHQDNDGKTPLHVAFECKEPSVAELLLNKFEASYKVRDARNWTPFHSAVDHGYYVVCYRLSRYFLEADANTDVSWIQLLAACYERKLQVVEFLLATNADANRVSSCGHTALHLACTKNAPEIVKLLLQNGAQQTINHRAVSQDLAPIHSACARGDAPVVQLLLEHGADPNIPCVKDKTPSHIAIATKNAEILQNLLRCPNINLNAVDSNGDTLLHVAVYEGNLEMVTLLLSHNADMNTFNHRCHSPLHTAIHLHENNIVQKLLEYNADPNLLDVDGDNCLQLALHGGREEVVPMLLKSGADTNATDKDGDSCLQLAIYRRCSAKTLQILIEHGAPLEHRNNKGYTALLIAGRHGYHDVVQLLVSSGCDPNKTDEDGESVLHYVIHRHGDKRTIQKLVDKGANINILNNKMRSPLLYACRMDNHDALSVLMDAKADPSLADKDGDTILHNAIHQGVSQHILREILIHCKQADLDATNHDGESALMLACRDGQNESVLMLLQAGASTALYDNDGDTCLHNAVRKKCRADVVKALVDHGAPLDAINCKGHTALLRACADELVEVFQLLLQRGADPNISDWDGDTPLHVVCIQNDSVKAALLLKHGADPNRKNSGGIEPLEYAIRAENTDLLEAFFNHNPALVDMIIDSRETALHCYCRKGRTDMVNWMLGYRADKDKVCVDGTPLDLALIHGHKNIVFMLLDAGADVSLSRDRPGFLGRIYPQRHLYMDILEHIIAGKNCKVDFTVRDAAHETLFCKACRDGDVDLVQMLLDSKHDIGINICNNEGQTPVAIICANAGKPEKEALSLLSMIINSGRDVDVDKADHKQTTPLHLVCQEDNLFMVNLIVRRSQGSVNARDSMGRTPVQLAKTSEVIHLLAAFGTKKE